VNFGVETMKKHELLVPAGNMECLRQAVLNGCDAVYLAGKNFGARKFAANFTNEEIVEAIRFCHLYGVRVYVTMNTLVKNEEVEAFLEQVSFLHEHHVDALIVQDFGMICYLREMFPNLEIHASTQANISSLEVCKLYHDLGVKRVVLAREMSIDEIDSIDVDIEKEVFIHGALCISYSGRCLMSAMLGGRSGNRGECAGVCRMPFSLLEGDNTLSSNSYLLSSKELNTSHQIKRLLDSNIDSFKIEGRMKGPLYVGFITRFYRKLMDGIPFSLDEEEKKLKTIFNREFTEGRLFEEKDEHYINAKSPNHVGLEIGKVVDVSDDKVKIQLQEGCSLHQGDAIRFVKTQEGFIVNYLYDEKGNLISSSENVCLVDNKVHLKKLDIVSKTQDFLLEKEFQEKIARKVPITFSVFARLHKPLMIQISDGFNQFSFEGNEVMEAFKTPVMKEDITRQLNKLGDTPFLCEHFDIQMDERVFFPISSLNECRRSLTTQLMNARMNFAGTSYVKKNVLFEMKSNSFTKILEKVHCLVFNKEQLEVCLKYDVDIYVQDENLYLEYQNQENVYYMVPECLFQISDSLKKHNVVADYLSSFTDSMIGNYGLNVMNIYTAYYLYKLGIKSLCLSVELDEKECSQFVQEYAEKFGEVPFIVLSYGRVENMIIKGNILHLNMNSYHYSLKDSRGRVFPVYYDGRVTHILNWEKKNMNVSSAISRIDFYDETKEEVEMILKRFLSK